MRLLPRSLAGQLIALLLIALVLSQAATVFIFADERRFALRAASRDQVLARTATLVRLLEETPGALHQSILDAARSPRLDFSLDAESAVRRPPANALEQSLTMRLSELIGDTRETRIRLLKREPWGLRNWHAHEHGSEEEEEDDDDRHPPHRRLGLPVSFLVSVPLTDGTWLNGETALPKPARAGAWFPLLSTGLMATAILAIVILSVRRITRPLRSLAEAAEKLGRGESLAPLSESGPREIRRTTAAFNAMQQRLTRFVQDRTRMLAAIGHDLRTPITALRLRAEFVEDPENRRKILETLDDMSRMTEAAISFAREEAASEPTRRVDLTALVQSFVDDLADQGRDAVFSADHGLEKTDYDCRPVALRRVLQNLVENALRYAGQARVRLAREARALHIIVEDDGPGIPEEHLERVFEPFVRLEESRSQATGGVGLGLAIARSIARAHGGDLRLENRPEGGLRAILILPLNAA